MKKYYNWKGINAPNNIKIHWINPEKNLLPNRLLNNNNTKKTNKTKLNPNARNYKPIGTIAINPRFKRNTTKKNKNKN